MLSRRPDRTQGFAEAFQTPDPSEGNPHFGKSVGPLSSLALFLRRSPHELLDRRSVNEYTVRKEEPP